jgi:predicted metalloprotease
VFSRLGSTHPWRLALVATVVTTLLLSGAPVAAQGTPEPQRYGRDAQGYTVQFAEVANELNAFWQARFAEAGADYRQPGITRLEALIDTACGSAGPEDFAFYCSLDATIYYSPSGFDDHNRRIGDFAPIVVMAHEWGHHVQWLAGIVPGLGNAFELQADCLAGAYTSDAGQRGLLDPGDVTEAVTSSAEAGDPLGLPQDAPGAHGINDDRITAFMRGYLDGPTGCNLIFTSAPAPPVEPRQPPQDTSVQPPPGSSVTPPVLAALVPSALDLPQGQSFRIFDEGATTLDALASGFPDPAEAAQLLLTWGWQGNTYRYYAADDPPADAAGWVELSIHRFASADAAAAALPYFAAGRASMLGLSPVPIVLFGDQSEALFGPAYNGTEMTIYARRGNLLIRATAIAPRGDPRGDVTEVALLPLRQLIDDVGVVSPDLYTLLPTAEMMPAGLVVAADQARSAATLADSFADPQEAGRLLQAWSWREHVARSFVAAGTGTANGTTQFDVAVYRFGNEAGAAQALPYFLDARAAALNLHEIPAPMVGDEARAIGGPVQEGQEVTLYVRAGSLLLRFTAVGAGNPMADIEALLGV